MNILSFYFNHLNAVGKYFNDTHVNAHCLVSMNSSYGRRAQNSEMGLPDRVRVIEDVIETTDIELTNIQKTMIKVEKVWGLACRIPFINLIQQMNSFTTILHMESTIFFQPI